MVEKRGVGRPKKQVSIDTTKLKREPVIEVAEEQLTVVTSDTAEATLATPVITYHQVETVKNTSIDIGLDLRNNLLTPQKLVKAIAETFKKAYGFPVKDMMFKKNYVFFMEKIYIMMVIDTITGNDIPYAVTTQLTKSEIESFTEGKNPFIFTKFSFMNKVKYFIQDNVLYITVKNLNNETTTCGYC